MLSENKLDEMARKLDRLCSIVESHGLPVGQLVPQETSTKATLVPTPTSMISMQAQEDGTAHDLAAEPALAEQAACATEYARSVFNFSVNSQEMVQSLGRLSEAQKQEHSEATLLDDAPILPDSQVHQRDVQMPPMSLALSCIQKL